MTIIKESQSQTSFKIECLFAYSNQALSFEILNRSAQPFQLNACTDNEVRIHQYQNIHKPNWVIQSDTSDQKY